MTTDRERAQAAFTRTLAATHRTREVTLDHVVEGLSIAEVTLAESVAAAVQDSAA